MQAESVPLDTMNQKLQLLEWQRDDYRSMSTQLSDLLSTVNTMTLTSSYTKAATVSDSSKVTVTPASGAGNATYTLTNATLATVATNQSKGVIATTDFDSSKPLIEQEANWNASGNLISWDSHSVSGETTNVSSDGTVFQLTNGAVSVDGTVKVTPEDSGSSSEYTVVTSKDAFDAADPDSNTVYVNPTTGQMTFNHTLEKGSTITTDYAYKTVNFNLTTYDSNGNAVSTNFNANGSLSLDSMLNKLNASGAGVNTFYDSATQKVAISTTNTGNNNTKTTDDSNGKEIVFNSSFLTSTLMLDSSKESGGTDANVTINGMATTRHSNTFTINNTTFMLNAEIPSTQTVTVGIDTDTDGMYDKIKSFVDQYNDVIEKINDMISVAPNRDYSPLTSAQKAQMSDTDISNWNEKARQGTLYNDNILTSVLSKMRQNFYSTVSGITGGSYSQLAQIGITTSSDYTAHGKLVIDESKLKSAIASDPDGVMKLFTSGNSSSSDTSSQGIAKRLYNTITNAVSQIKTQAGTTSLVNDQFNIGRSINSLSDQISSFQDHLKMIQTRYYTQFTAMESAIQSANSQASYLSSMFSS
jgi:flagellar hook-associated protein 2